MRKNETVIAAAKNRKLTSGCVFENESLISAISDVVSTDIPVQIVGVQPFYLIAVVNGVPRTPVLRKTAVDPVHPGRAGAALKLVKIADSLDVSGVV